MARPDAIDDQPAKPVRVWTHVDRAMFEAEIQPLGQPAVLNGLVDDWPVVSAGRSSKEATRDYLLQFDKGAVVNALAAAPATNGRYFYDAAMRGFNFDRFKVPARTLIDNLVQPEPGREGFYVYSAANAADTVFPGFSQANANPLTPPGTEPLVWIGNTARIAPHYDGSENIACCVRGERQFLLFPPEQIGNLYVGPLHFTMAGQPASLVDPRHPDFGRYPRYAQARQQAFVAKLEPGDAIYIPTLWWHYVESQGDLNVLVNYWWSSGKSGSGIASLAHALLNLREMAANERSAWRAFFDHYVFDDDAVSAGSHIPEHARGVLDRPSAQRDAMIRSYVKGSL